MLRSETQPAAETVVVTNVVEMDVKKINNTSKTDKTSKTANKALLAMCMEQMRVWLCWRKWYRINGMAYARPIDRRTDTRWLVLNNYTSVLRHPISEQLYLLDTVLRSVYLRDFEPWQLQNADMIRTALLLHYERYSAASVEDKFLIRYLENLRQLMGRGQEDRADNATAESLVDQMIRDYRQTYFRNTFTIDHTARSIDDSVLWYYLQCLYVSEAVITRHPLNGNDHTVDYEVLGDTFVVWREPNGNWSAAPKTTTTETEETTASNPLAIHLFPPPRKTPVSDDRLWTRYLRLALLLNTPSLSPSTPLGTLNDDAQLAFQLLYQTEATNQSRADTVCQMNRFMNLVQLSMLNVIDLFVWRLVFEPHDDAAAVDEIDSGYVRLAPTANAVQLAAKKYRTGTTASGLGLLDAPPRFLREEQTVAETASLLPVCVYVTNVMLDSQTVSADRRDRSFFLLHENSPKLVSVFVRPDQDPRVPYVLDPHNESECERGRYLRWIIATLDEHEPLTPSRMARDCVSLLRDIKRSVIKDGVFVVDPFMCRSSSGGSAGVTGTPSYYSSEKISQQPQQLQLHDDALFSLCSTLEAGKVLLRGRPKTCLYCPLAAQLLPVDLVGLVPWTVNRSDAFDWKCFSREPIEGRQLVRLSDIQLLVQQQPKTNNSLVTYTLSDPREIRDFLRSGQCNGLPRLLPMVRVLPRAPFKIYKIVAKRVFTLQDGTVFVTTAPLKFAEPLERGSLKIARYLDNSEVCPLRWQRFGCFDRSEIAGSEIWFPRVVNLNERRRCYHGIPREIVPLIAWLDRIVLTAAA